MKRELQCRSPKKSVSRLNTSRLISISSAMRFCLFAVSCILMPFLKTNKRPYPHWKLFSQTNSSMTDLSVLYSKVNDLWLLYTSYIIIVLWPLLWHKQVAAELPEQREQTKLVWSLPSRVGSRRSQLPNGFQNLHPMMFSLMVSTMYLTSSSLTYGPAGKHIPTLKRASDTPLIYATLLSDV